VNLENLFSLKDRVALVTGGSRGLGKIIAAGFIAQGARVYISSRKADACAETALELGPMCTPLPCDVASVEGCETLARTFSAKEPKLDILVNNAGAAWGAQIDTFPEQGWDKVVDLNLKSPFFLTQKLLGVLRAVATAERPAKVINIASVDGLRQSPWETYSYHASKAGLFHLTRRMAAQLAKEHINVTSIAPGAFASDMNRAARDRAEQVGRTIPAGRIGRPEDIAAAAIYLAAASGDYVVGSSVTVDGGLVDACFGPSIDGDD
jgi:NAD(P)-dependent dehydrogenase (short-subunit alcohol dehydrogenase family)